MSDEKPFARVEMVDGEYRWLAGDAVLDTDSVGWPTLAITWRQELCDAINDAVEQREARLRGAIHDAALREYHQWGGDSGDDRPGHLVLEEIIRRIPTYALPADAQEYVPKSRLDEAEAKLKGSWGVLLDEMLNRGGAPEALALAEKLGMKIEPAKALAALSDEQLREECARRGFGGLVGLDRTMYRP